MSDLLFYLQNNIQYQVSSKVIFQTNLVGSVMVSVLASSVVDRGIEPGLDQTKDCQIGICYFSANHPALRTNSKDLLSSESG